MIEPVIYTNLYGTQLLLADGTFTDVEYNTDWEYSRPIAFRQQFIENFIRLHNACNIPKSKFFMIHTDSFGLPQLLNLSLDDKKVQEINRRGLEIYLSEILIKYTGENVLVDRSNFLEVFNTAPHKYRFDYNENEKIGVIQFDYIDKFVTKNKLTNVKVYVIEKDYKNIFDSYKNFQIEYFDSFLTEYVNNLKYKSSNQNIKYNFLCTNFGYAVHRHAMVSYLIHENSKISWAYESSIEHLTNYKFFNFSHSKYYSKIKKGVEKLNSCVPLSLDVKYEKLTTTGQVNDIMLLPADNVPLTHKENIYDDIFCSVVCESEFFEVTSNVSEKTINAIFNKRPFVVCGSPNTLRLLKELGFKTFSNFWNEEYDNEYNSELRLNKVFEVLDYIKDLTIEDCKNLLTEMQNILEHNYQNLKKLRRFS